MSWERVTAWDSTFEYGHQPLWFKRAAVNVQKTWRMSKGGPASGRYPFAHSDLFQHFSSGHLLDHWGRRTLPGGSRSLVTQPYQDDIEALEKIAMCLGCNFINHNQAGPWAPGSFLFEFTPKGWAR